MPGTKNLKHAFYQFLKFNHLIPQNSAVLVAVSGGQDSVALLDLLVQWQKGLQLTLGVAHIHHHLRPSADDDARFVETLAAKYHLPFFRKDVDVKQLVEERQLSLEAAARQLRESALVALAHEHGFQFIATGHTLSDQVETVLMRMFQGTGLPGLAGIRLNRPPFVRPLLFATRDEISRYVQQKQLAFREDETNRDTRFLRNRLRHQIIPFLKSHFPNFREEAIGHLALVTGEWLPFFEDHLKTAWENVVIEYSQLKITLELSRFLQYFSGIQFGIVDKAISHVKGEHVFLNYHKFKHFLYWVGQTAGRPEFWFDNEIGVSRCKNRFTFFNIHRLRQWREQLQGKVVPLEGTVNLGEKTLILSRVSLPVTLPPKSSQMEFIDARCAATGLTIGFPEEKMWFHPLGSHRAVPVMEFLKKAGIPGTFRPFTPLLVSRERIVAIPGLRINDECKITDETKAVIKIELRESYEYA